VKQTNSFSTLSCKSFILSVKRFGPQKSLHICILWTKDFSDKMMFVYLMHFWGQEETKKDREQKHKRTEYKETEKQNNAVDIVLSSLVGIIAFLTLDKRQKLVMDHILNRSSPQGQNITNTFANLPSTFTHSSWRETEKCGNAYNLQ